MKGRENQEAADAALKKKLAEVPQAPPPRPEPSPPLSTEVNERRASKYLEQPARVILTFGGAIVLYVKTVPAIGDQIRIPESLAPNGRSTVVEVTGRCWEAVKLPTGDKEGVLPSITILTVKNVGPTKPEVAPPSPKGKK